MLYLEIREKPYADSRIKIVPDNSGRILNLRNVRERDFMIENPSKVFTRKVKQGEYDNVSEYKMSAEARIMNILSPVWKLPM